VQAAPKQVRTGAATLVVKSTGLTSI